MNRILLILNVEHANCHNKVIEVYT